MSQRIAVIGLGSMGYGMAQSCVRAGFRVHGMDVVPEAVERLMSEGGDHTPLDDVASALDAVVVMVLNAAQVETVLFGDAGLVPKLRKGAVVLACATVPPDFAREMSAKCAAHGVLYLDAPVSGGAAKAAAGQLSIMASGEPEAFDAAADVLAATAATVFRLGDAPGAGSAMKAVNQMLAGVHIAAMAEALTFGMTQNIAPATFVDVISKCAGTSWMLENRSPHVVEGDYTPRSQVNIWPKDLGIVLDAARAVGFDAPLTQAALAQYVQAVEMGLGGQDDAAVAKVYAERSGLDLPN